MKNIWRDYWRATNELPKKDMNCLVMTEMGAYRKAKFLVEENKFVIIKKRKNDVSISDVTDVARWIPYPFSEIKKDNPEVPVECVYRHLYEEWQHTRDAVNILKGHIRTLYKFIDKGEINEEAMQLINVAIKGRLGGITMSKIEEAIQKEWDN